MPGVLQLRSWQWDSFCACWLWNIGKGFGLLKKLNLDIHLFLQMIPASRCMRERFSVQCEPSAKRWILHCKKQSSISSPFISYSLESKTSSPRKIGPAHG